MDVLLDSSDDRKELSENGRCLFLDDAPGIPHFQTPSAVGCYGHQLLATSQVNESTADPAVCLETKCRAEDLEGGFLPPNHPTLVRRHPNGGVLKWG